MADKSKQSKSGSPWVMMGEPYTTGMLTNDLEQMSPLEKLAYIDRRADKLETGGLTGQGQLLNRSVPGVGGVNDEYNGVLDKAASSARWGIGMNQPMEEPNGNYENMVRFLEAERVRRLMNGGGNGR